MTTALRALLEGAVDYAGLFPPAALDLPDAVRNYASYRSSAERWMLGRFVVGVAKLPELRATIARLRQPEPWPLSVVAPNAPAATSVLRAPDDASVRIESVEVKATTAADIVLVGRAAPKTRDVYVEIATDRGMTALLDVVATAKLRAKIRTGGVTPEGFPTAEQVVEFIRACIDRGLPFKATAGLHHPLRGAYPLTYDSGAPRAEMFGYLNVFLAAAFMREGMPDADAVALLLERDPAAISLDEQVIRWREHVLPTEAIRASRARGLTSFGSCSFREPVEELPFPLSREAPS